MKYYLKLHFFGKYQFKILHQRQVSKKISRRKFVETKIFYLFKLPRNSADISNTSFTMAEI